MALTRIKTDQVLDGTITNDDLATDIALNTSGNITTTGDVTASTLDITSTTASTSTSTGAITVAGGIGVAGAVRAANLGMTNVVTNRLLKFNGTIIDDAIISDDGSTASVGGNLSLTGNLLGPATFYIDPSPHVPDTDGETNGVVVIRGDLQVDGTTTTVNSTTMDVADLNITLASGAANAAAADGAGLTVDGASATLLYDGTNDLWQFNKGVKTDVGVTIATAAPSFVLQDAAGTYFHRLRLNASNSLIVERYDGTSTLSTLKLDETGDVQFYENNGGTPQVGMHWDYADGRLGIGDTGPDDTIHLNGGANESTGITIGNNNSTRLRLYHNDAAGSSYLTTDGMQTEQRLFIMSGNDLRLGSGGTVRVNITSGGDVYFYDTNADVGMAWDASVGSDGALLVGGHTSLRSGSVGGGNDAQLSLESTNSHYASFIENQDNASGYALFIGKSRGTSAGDVDIVEDGDTAGSVTFVAADGTDLRPKIAEISAVVTPGTTPAVNQISGDLVFSTTNQGQNPTSRMRITNDGKVGIGNDDPTYDLDVTGQGRFTTDLRIGSENLRLSTDGSGEFGLGYGSTHATANRLRIYQNTTPVFGVRDDGAIDTEQVRHSIRPTLNLDFANNKTFDPRISFYRDSLGTYYDSKGLLKYAQYNEPRFDHDPSTGESKGLLIEPARNNIFINTNNPERWSLTSFGSGGFTSAANARISPDGKYNATSIIINGGDPYFYQNNLSLNGTYVFSYWIKAWGNAVGKHYTTRITNVSVNQSISDTLPSEWTRKVYEFTTSSTTTAYIGVEAPDNSPADGDEISIWGAQLELGTYVTSYVPSEELFTYRASRATYQDANGYLKEAPVDSPRYGYRWDGRNKYIETGFIQELAETNLAPQTENFSSSWYTFGYSKLQTTRTILPNGTEDFVTKIIMNSGQVASSPTSLGVYIGTGMSRVQNNVYNTSIFAKAADENGFRIRDGLRTGAFFDVNLDNGEITNGSASTFLNPKTEKYANGWWRISFDYQYTGATGSGGWMPIRSYNDGNGTKGFYIWGAQVESGGCTSYIPNYSGASGAVTRAEDVTYSTSSTRQRDEVFAKDENVTSWYNTEEGTLLTEDSVEPDHSYAMVWSLQNTDSIGDGYISQFQIGTGGNFNTDTRYTGANFDVASGTQSGAGVFTKRAIRLKDDDMNAGSNGTLPTSADTDGHLPSDVSVLHIGYRSDGYQYAGHMKKFVYYPVALTDNELKALTENN
jgi:hypothetical protein